MQDSTLIKTAAMPNAANTTATGVIDLAQRAVRPSTTGFRVGLKNTIATGANSKNITYNVYGTNGTNEANGGNATLIDSFVVGGNAANHAASSREFYLPPELNKKKIYATATGEANGGNAGDGTMTLEILD